MRWLSAGIVLALCAVGPLHGGDGKLDDLKKITYGKGGQVSLELDLMIPPGKGPFPAVLCIHGGAWRGGSRQSLTSLAETLARKGFVAATISYRLAPDAQFPAQIEDCKAAVRFLRAHAEKYRIKPDRIAALGFSAGAHLACLLGTADAAAGLEGEGGNAKQSSRVQAVVSFFGPTDLTTKTWSADIEKLVLIPFLGGTLEEKGELYRKCSPIIYCTRDDPPFLFFHGTKDTIVGIDQSQKLAKKLREVGVSAELVTMEGEGHGWNKEKMADSINRSVRFLQDKLK